MFQGISTVILTGKMKVDSNAEEFRSSSAPIVSIMTPQMSNIGIR